MSQVPRRGRAWVALVLFGGLFGMYNANGREIGTVDSQAAKFTARELAVRHTLVLDGVVAAQPGLAPRVAFQRDRAGHVRDGYPIAPALLAALPAVVLQTTGLVDMDAPLAANLIAALTASTLTAAAVVLVFLALTHLTDPRRALLVALGLGLGTNYWALVSQTLWQHETVAFGLALALWSWLRPVPSCRPRHLALGGIGLALAGAGRPQTAPLVLGLLAWAVARVGWRRACLPASIVATAAVAVMVVNEAWFGSVLGAAWRIEVVHPATHAVSGTFTWHVWTGAIGLLVSPSRGLLVFSPIVLVCAAGLGRLRARPDLGLGWLAAAASVQFVLYAAYTVWWGGHTYGPRYLLDLLPPLAPVAALGLDSALATPARRAITTALLAWSILVAGAGAFVYPNDRWNSDPVDVDTHHERLWDVRDSQIVRTLTCAPSPQNADLWRRAAFSRRPF